MEVTGIKLKIFYSSVVKSVLKLKPQSPKLSTFCRPKKGSLMKCVLGTLFWSFLKKHKVPRHTSLFYY